MAEEPGGVCEKMIKDIERTAEYLQKILDAFKDTSEKNPMGQMNEYCNPDGAQLKVEKKEADEAVSDVAIGNNAKEVKAVRKISITHSAVWNPDMISVTIVKK